MPWWPRRFLPIGRSLGSIRCCGRCFGLAGRNWRGLGGVPAKVVINEYLDIARGLWGRSLAWRTRCSIDWRGC